MRSLCGTFGLSAAMGEMEVSCGHSAHGPKRSLSVADFGLCCPSTSTTRVLSAEVVPGDGDTLTVYRFLFRSLSLHLGSALAHRAQDSTKVLYRHSLSIVRQFEQGTPLTNMSHRICRVISGHESYVAVMTYLFVMAYIACSCDATFRWIYRRLHKSCLRALRGPETLACV